VNYSSSSYGCHGMVKGLRKQEKITFIYLHHWFPDDAGIFATLSNNNFFTLRPQNFCGQASAHVGQVVYSIFPRNSKV
jgi:hypothetical protein